MLRTGHWKALWETYNGCFNDISTLLLKSVWGSIFSLSTFWRRQTCQVCAYDALKCCLHFGTVHMSAHAYSQPILLSYIRDYRSRTYWHWWSELLMLSILHQSCSITRCLGRLPLNEHSFLLPPVYNKLLKAFIICFALLTNYWYMLLCLSSLSSDSHDPKSLTLTSTTRQDPYTFVLHT